MIKRVFSLTLAIVILMLAFQFIVNLFKTDHKVEYSLKIDDKDYEIVEIYKKRKNFDSYLFNVKVDEYNFIIERENDFNKQKNIVKDIKTYKKDDVFCLSLIFSADKVESSPICIKNNKLYSHYSLSDEYNFDEFLSKLPNYKKQLINSDSNSVKVKDLFVYEKNQYEDEILLVYNYNSIIRITSSYDDLLTFGSFDEYKNKAGRLIGKYYLIPQNTTKTVYSKFYAFDVTNQIKKEIKPVEDVSKQIYVNGIYDNKLYLFDKSNLIQYEFDPYEEKANIIGTQSIPAIIYRNGTKEEISVYELEKSEITFSDDITGYENIVFDKIFVFGEYAIYSKGNNIYKVYKDLIENPILISKAQDLKEMKVINDRIYYINNDTLYRCDNNGIIPLIKREEFKYNSLNIFDVYINE